MITKERQFHCIGELTISKAKNLNVDFPYCDNVNWLFIKIGEHRYGFIYEIVSVQSAHYEIPFEIKMSFLWPEEVIKYAVLGQQYEIYRGEEKIGIVQLRSMI